MSAIRNWDKSGPTTTKVSFSTIIIQSYWCMLVIMPVCPWCPCGSFWELHNNSKAACRSSGC